MTSPLPFLTADRPGLGGRIKVEPEDFVVEEVPLYLPSGVGEHLFLWIEKRDVSGEQLLDHLARTLRVSRGDIGMAGLKDRRAVTRQFVSIPRNAEPRVADVDAPGIRVLRALPHGNKLRTGHLAGNRFEILIRDVVPAALAGLDQLVQRLSERGFPNAYGDQRFGRDGETLALGLALLRGERTERDIPPQRRRFLLRLALSSVQSQLFNDLLAERQRHGTLHGVEAGDVMQVVASGGCFIAADLPTEQARFDQRETMITGPIFGPKMKSASGIPGAREQQVLAAAALTIEHFRRFPKLLPGARRPLLCWPQGLMATPSPTGVRLEFLLPSGAYATTLLSEILGAAQNNSEPDVPVETERGA
jgi:tRNA pseudouridine13 synthase